VISLQGRLTTLSTLLEDSKKLILENEAKNIQDIESLSKSYERKLLTYKIVGGSLVGVIIVGIIYTTVVK
jgi:hypothetical protein